MLAFAAFTGAFFRLLFGGAPHREPLKSLVPRPVVYLLFIALGYIIALHPYVLGGDKMHFPSTWHFLWDWRALVVAIVLAAGWSPGHGSYLSPGNGSPDNEPIAPIVRALSFGQPAGSVFYCTVGMAMRYSLLCTFPAALAMFLLGSPALVFGYALVGLLAGPIVWLTAVTKLNRVAFLPWCNPQFNNGWFEMGVGALIYGGFWCANL